jgi:diacylglycerol kinase family enzyme
MPTAKRRAPAVLVVNPNAGRLPEQSRQDVIGALRSRFKVETYSTTARDTGITIAADAAAAGAELVVAFGGDGHVNEVANGVVHTDTALGIIPGGTMNVFARALQIPLDPLAAIDHLEEALNGPPRRVSLGQMDERYFTFSAGCGFDAEAAERVERYVPAKRRFGELFFYWSAVRVLAGSYRHRSPSMTLTGPFGDVPVSMAIACNAGPYAYLAGVAVDIAPNVRLDGGLDVFALKQMRVEQLPFYAWRVLVTRDIAGHGDAFYASDLDKFEITADEPFSRHVDGEPLAPGRSARFSLATEALLVRG